MKTSFFASKAPQERKVSIAKYPPRYWKGKRAKELAPSNPKADDWAEEYLRDLELRFPNGEGLKEYLENIENDIPNAILCCYELEPSECHRRILAKYVYEHLGITIEEWKSGGLKQGSLI